MNPNKQENNKGNNFVLNLVSSMSSIKKILIQMKEDVDNLIVKLENLRDLHIARLKNKPLTIYLFPTFLVTTSLFLKYLLYPYIDLSLSPYLLFITAIIISSWYAGLRAGIYATLLSAFLADYFLFYPYYSLFDNRENFSLTLFTAIGITLSWLNDELLYMMRKAKLLSQINQLEKDTLDVIMENTDAHLAYLDNKFNFIKVNSTYAKGSGYSKEKLIGKNHFKLFPNTENEKIFKQAIKTGKPYFFKAKPFAFVNQPEKGTTYWDWALTPIKNNSGKVKNLVLSLVDVTEPIKTKENLQAANKSLQIYGKIINNSSDLISVIAKNYTHKLVNPTYEKLYNLPTKEIVGSKISKLIGEKTFKETVKSKIDLSFKGQSIEYGAWFNFKNNGRKYMIVRYYPLEENGNIKDVVVVAHDETKEKIAREIQRSLNKKISIILESITDAFFAVDEDWNFTYVNTQAEKYLGKTKTDLIGRNLWKTFREFKNTKLYEIFYGKEQHSTTFEEYLEQHAKWFEFRTYFSRDGLSVYFKDITDRKELENRKDEFISIASHELKTPLTSAKAYTEIFHKTIAKLNSEEKDHYFIRITDQLNKLNTLINELLDVSKIQLGKIEFNKEELDIDKLVNQTIEDLKRVIKKHQIIKQGKVTEKIIGDRLRLSQLLTNLLVNAAKYSPEANKILVKVIKNGQNIVVGVKDYGIGIEKEKQKKIFDKYYQIKNPQKGKFPGIGLGLYISSKIIEAHGGKIWVESEENKGSIFYFSLPV